jgi:hypothetical protein
MGSKTALVLKEGARKVERNGLSIVLIFVQRDPPKPLHVAELVYLLTSGQPPSDSIDHRERSTHVV